MKEKEKKEKSKTSTKSIRLKTLLAGFGIVLVALVAITGVFVFVSPQNSLAMRVRDILPYPAVVMSGKHFIMYKDVDTNLASIRRFYENQSDDLSKAGMRIDFSTPEGQKRLMIREKELLNKMTEDTAIRTLAEDRGIVITSEEVSRTVNQKISTLGNNREEVTKQLDRLYGWGIADFEHKIVRPALYKEALTKVFAKDFDTSSQAKKKIEEAGGALKQGMSFEDVAKKYSEGKTAQDGGELGWIPVSTLAPEIKVAIQNQKINQASDIVESELGFHIVAIEERKQEQDQEVIRLKQVFTKKITFADWLTQQMKKMNVIVLFKGYMWDKETARIEFKQQEMKLFEENMLKTAQGDASLIY